MQKNAVIEKKKYILIISILLTLIIILLLFILLIKYTYKPTISEKTNFSENETKQICDLLDVHSDKVNIDKLTLSHAKDTLFMIYISNLILEDIVPKYSEYEIQDNKTHCIKTDNHNIECILYKENGKDIAVFRLEYFNDNLYDMVK